MKKFNLNKYDYYSNNYSVNILDIWCQEGKISAYVEGSYIYKVMLEVENNEIYNYYCSCPSSNGGMSFCKHLKGVENYLKEHEILEMECEIEIEDEIDNNLSNMEIVYKFKEKIEDLVDDNTSSINCFCTDKFTDIVLNYSKYISNFIKQEKLDRAFDLICSFLIILNNTNVDNYDEYEEMKQEILCYADELIEKYDYFDKMLDYFKVPDDITCDDLDLLHRIIDNVDNNINALKIIKIIDNLKIDDYKKNDLIVSKIELTHDYISLESAIKLAKKHKNIYSVEKLLIKYMEETNDEVLLIEELKRQVKSNKDEKLFNQLLNIYRKNNNEKEMINLLCDMIITLEKIKYYKHLKQLINKKDLKIYRQEIIAKINKKRYSQHTFILEIYLEDNLLDELIEKLEEYNNLDYYKDYSYVLNKNYHDRLLDDFKKSIIKVSSKCTNRNDYCNVCEYIKHLYTLDCSSEYIKQLLTEMSFYYKNKKAFKDELNKVLKETEKPI